MQVKGFERKFWLFGGEMSEGVGRRRKEEGEIYASVAADAAYDASSTSL
jgi:hypothetical protein